MEDDLNLGAFALTPIWFRLLLLYVTAGFLLSVYQAKRAAGSGRAAAAIAALTAGLVTPFTAFMLAISAFSGLTAWVKSFWPTKSE